MYNFCKAFKVSPEEFKKCEVDDVDMLLLIDQEVREEERKEMEQNARRRNIKGKV